LIGASQSDISAAAAVAAVAGAGAGADKGDGRSLAVNSTHSRKRGDHESSNLSTIEMPRIEDRCARE